MADWHPSRESELVLRRLVALRPDPGPFLSRGETRGRRFGETPKVFSLFPRSFVAGKVRLVPDGNGAAGGSVDAFRLETGMDWMTRRLWGAMLHLMRRPWIRALRRASLSAVPRRWRPRVERSIARQNLFALRHGRKIVRWAIGLVLTSFLVTSMYVLALEMQARGLFEVPLRP